MKTIHLFGLNIWKAGMKEALASFRSVLQDATVRAKLIVTPNVDHIVKLHLDSNLLDIYGQADYIFPDGFPIVLASKLFGKTISERVTGADLFPALCLLMAKRRGRIFVLGGAPGSELEIDEKLSFKYPGLQVRSFCPPYGFSEKNEDAFKAVDLVNDWLPEVVFVCLGMPKQERWSFEYRDILKTKLILCVGAALEFDLGLLHRAPKWVQTINMEWLWRLCSDFDRLWKRYLVDDVAFIKIVFLEFLLSLRTK